MHVFCFICQLIVSFPALWIFFFSLGMWVCCNWQTLCKYMCKNVHFLFVYAFHICVRAYVRASMWECVAWELNFVWFHSISHRVFANRFNKNEHGCFVNHDNTFGKFLPEHLKDCCFMRWIHFCNLVDSCLLCIFLCSSLCLCFYKEKPNCEHTLLVCLLFSTQMNKKKKNPTMFFFVFAHSEVK